MYRNTGETSLERVIIGGPASLAICHVQDSDSHEWGAKRVCHVNTAGCSIWAPLWECALLRWQPVGSIQMRHHSSSQTLPFGLRAGASNLRSEIPLMFCMVSTRVCPGKANRCARIASAVRSGTAHALCGYTPYMHEAHLCHCPVCGHSEERRRHNRDARGTGFGETPLTVGAHPERAGGIPRLQANEPIPRLTS